MSRSTKMISEGEIMFARSNACVAMESIAGTMVDANHVERCFAAGMMCVTSFKIARELERFGVEFDD